ncbi:MAG: molecular chaperone [Desulfobacteraceae bacterium IS3]|nr:MAG: molecular chaperone [Desulfobacteraceae bacterium IS3]
MPIVKWDPLRNIAALQDRINKVFDETFRDGDPPENSVSICAWRPAVDIYETENGIIIKAELPGVRKEDISVEVKDNILTLKGERIQEKEVIQEKYFRRERCFGTFHRSFTMQDVVNPDKIKAGFKDGVLEVEVPKPEAEKPKQIKVNIE